MTDKNDEVESEEDVARYINDPKNAKAVRAIKRITRDELKSVVKEVASEQPSIFDGLFKFFGDE